MTSKNTILGAIQEIKLAIQVVISKSPDCLEADLNASRVSLSKVEGYLSAFPDEQSWQRHLAANQPVPTPSVDEMVASLKASMDRVLEMEKRILSAIKPVNPKE